MNDKNYFITSFLKKAEDTLIDAAFNLENKKLNTAQNRIYFAIFYSVVALGYAYGFVTVKHKQLMGWFNKEFIYKHKIFDPAFFDIYREAYENRIQVDYTLLSSGTKSDITESFNSAKTFIQKISNHINQKLNTQQ